MIENSKCSASVSFLQKWVIGLVNWLNSLSGNMVIEKF